MKLATILVLFTLSICLFYTSANAAQTDIVGPAGSGNFGLTVTVLPNGNIVVVDPGYDLSGPTVADVGAVHLYDGTTLALISTLTGSTASDSVGASGITILTNGNFVVRSQSWNGNRGAVTFVNGSTGLSGVVSSSNSLVGSTAGDIIGTTGVTALTNGNFVVSSVSWDNGAIVDAGAVTWGNGTTGTVGVVSGANSLVGSAAFDNVGFSGITALTNGNYIVRAPAWDNGPVLNVGAVTWGNGATGTVGSISSANSLVGSTANDNVGNVGIFALTNGNYVVSSPNWDNGVISNAGAVTWGNGLGGTIGTVSSANSLVGSSATDQIGGAVTALTNGNYVVRSSSWDNGAIGDAGAVTWGNGTTGISGVISLSNSLIGSTPNDQVGSNGITALTNGNYVVSSPFWDNPSPVIANAGAVTWGNGISGTVGLVTSSNSLIGGSVNDSVGSSGVRDLTNGNYVVRSQNWDNPSPFALNAGAVTWGNGASGTSGFVSSSNSLVGSSANDVVGGVVTVLTNGNYVVTSSAWDNPLPAAANAGAVTWGNGAGGTVGPVSSTNSLVGSMVNDNVGNGGVTVLTNGSYVVISPVWDNGAITDVGAITRGNGAGGTVGVISAANSLVGTTAFDIVGDGGVVALTNGNYVVRSVSWANGAIVDAGAVTWGNGAGGTVGAVSSANSLVGSAASDFVGNFGLTALTNGNYVVGSVSWDNGAIANAGAYTFGNGVSGTSGLITNGASGGNSVVGTVGSGITAFAFDASRNRLIVGRSASNTVSILSFTTTAIADGDLSNAANWSAGVPNGLVTGIIPSGRTMTISSKMNIGLLHVQCGGNLTGGSASAYIVGSVRRDFCGAVNEAFTYPIGDPSNYSPLTTDKVYGSGSLTAAVIDDFLPGVPQAVSLSRRWSLVGSGIVTDLNFTYVDADVNGMEAGYSVFRRSSSTNLTVRMPGTTVNTATNTITAPGVFQFSDWGVGNAPAVPTASNVSVSGRVMTPDGRGLRNAVVHLTDANGQLQTTRTSAFGYYRFDDVESGQTVVISVTSKQYSFAQRIINLTDSVTDLDLVALPE